MNPRLRVSGICFQSRFATVVMDEDHLILAAGCVLLNPAKHDW